MHMQADLKSYELAHVDSFQLKYVQAGLFIAH